jgi:hypothetical protein
MGASLAKKGKVTSLISALVATVRAASFPT